MSSRTRNRRERIERVFDWRSCLLALKVLSLCLSECFVVWKLNVFHIRASRMACSARHTNMEHNVKTQKWELKQRQRDRSRLNVIMKVCVKGVRLSGFLPLQLLLGRGLKPASLNLRSKTPLPICKCVNKRMRENKSKERRRLEVKMKIRGARKIRRWG